MKVPGLSLGLAGAGNNAPVPVLNMSAVEQQSDSYTSSKSQSEDTSNSNRPKLGPGLDLTKAKNIQQEHLEKAAKSK